MAQVDMPKSSIGQTPTEPKKKLEKVVKGKVTVKEQSDMQKIASQFLAEDLKTVKDRILTDYLLPATPETRPLRGWRSVPLHGQRDLR